MVAQRADRKEALEGRVFERLPQQVRLHLLLGSILRDSNANGIAKCRWRALHKVVARFAQ